MSSSDDKHDSHGEDGHTHGPGRGVSRPMAMKQQQQQQQQHGGSGDESDHDRRMRMLHMHHQQTLWVYWTLILLGVWLVVAPFAFGYLNESLWVDPSGGRGAWFAERPIYTALRASLMAWSDVISGALLIVFGWRALQPNRPVSLWICCFVGIWLTFAPVLFWAPTAAAYLNDTIVGMLVIALAILIPGMPNMIMYMQHGPPTPGGWSYNPSSWPQRWIMIGLGFAGLAVSRYLGMFQLGYIDRIWEPFFGAGTRQVLNSDMSHMWPVSDAAFGAVAYTFEFLMGWMGSPARWRTMPWMVTIFGILVIPLGLVHIALVISQPVVVGHWCTLCLLAAAIMLPMIPLEIDEVVAMGQHMVQAKRRGDRGGSWWTIFWKGGQAEGAQPDERSPELMELPRQPGRVFLASIWGMSFPWTLVVAAALGVWLMAQPGVLGDAGFAADIFHLGGALVVTVSVISMGEVVRAGRYLNVLPGLIIAIGPWFTDGATTAGAMVGTLVGLAVIGLSLPRGAKRERYGAWDRYVV